MRRYFYVKTKKLKLYQKIALIFWIAIILTTISFRIFYPQYFSIETIGNLLSKNNSFTLTMFLILVCLRPLILVPGSILTFAGLLVFDAWTVFIISMIGVTISGTGVYFLAEILGFAEMLEARFQHQIKNLQPKIQQYGNWFIGIWSAFPFVPDDLICYFSGSLRFPFWQFIFAFTIGGALPIAIYSFGGTTIFDYLLSK